MQGTKSLIINHTNINWQEKQSMMLCSPSSSTISLCHSFFNVVFSLTQFCILISLYFPLPGYNYSSHSQKKQSHNHLILIQSSALEMPWVRGCLAAEWEGWQGQELPSMNTEAGATPSEHRIGYVPGIEGALFSLFSHTTPPISLCKVSFIMHSLLKNLSVIQPHKYLLILPGSPPTISQDDAGLPQQ